MADWENMSKTAYYSIYTLVVIHCRVKMGFVIKGWMAPNFELLWVPFGSRAGLRCRRTEVGVGG